MRCRSPKTAQRNFWTMCGKIPPNVKRLKSRYNKFKTTDTVADVPRTGRSSISAERVKRVRQPINALDIGCIFPYVVYVFGGWILWYHKTNWAFSSFVNISSFLGTDTVTAMLLKSATKNFVIFAPIPHVSAQHVTKFPQTFFSYIWCYNFEAGIFLQFYFF